MKHLYGDKAIREAEYVQMPPPLQVEEAAGEQRAAALRGGEWGRREAMISLQV